MRLKKLRMKNRLHNHIIINDEGYKELARQVIIQAVRDYLNPEIKGKNLIKGFFNSPLFEFYCSVSDLNPEWMRTNIYRRIGLKRPVKW